MDMQIYFPNLGIFLENIGKNFNVFGFEIAFYGCTMATGIIVGYLMAAREAKSTGQNPDDYLDMLLYAVFFAIIGARLYYVIFKWDYYGQNLMQIFNLRQGGLAIYGGIIGAFTTVYFFAKKRKLSFAQMLDTACPGLAAGQVIGRWEISSIVKHLADIQTDCLRCSFRYQQYVPVKLQNRCGKTWK